MIATGSYINIYEENGMDIFIIINEPNDVDMNIMRKATTWLEENDIDTTDLALKLEEKFFKYGVQVIVKKGASV